MRLRPLGQRFSRYTLFKTFPEDQSISIQNFFKLVQRLSHESLTEVTLYFRICNISRDFTVVVWPKFRHWLNVHKQILISRYIICIVQKYFRRVRQRYRNCNKFVSCSIQNKFSTRMTDDILTVTTDSYDAALQRHFFKARVK